MSSFNMRILYHPKKIEEVFEQKNCGDFVIVVTSACTCGAVYFTSILTISAIKLEVGNLVSENCTLDDYVIDWYKGDYLTTSKKFTTGKLNTNPDVIYLHPLIGNAAVPVESGTWYPVLRYIEVGGVKFYGNTLIQPENGIYCANLPSVLIETGIIITALECTNGVSSYDSYYSASVVYKSILNTPTDSSQTIDFKINSATTHFAWKFVGEQVADRVTFYYHTTAFGDVLIPYSDWSVGVDATFSLVSTPKKTNLEQLRRVISLASYTYQPTDFIRIVIVPSFATPSQHDTNWRIDLKCLSSFDCTNGLTSNMNKIDVSSINVIWNSVSCRYEVHYDTIDATPVSFGSTGITRYHDTSGQAYGYTLTSSALSGGKHNSGSYGGTSYIVGYMNIWTTTKYLLNGKLTYNKTGPIFTLSFNNVLDYNKWKADYNIITGYTTWNNYSADPMNLNHYQFIRTVLLTPKIAGAVLSDCGDSSQDTNYFISRHSTFVFDDLLYKITINLVQDTMDMPASCNLYSAVNGYIYNVNNLLVQPNFSGETICRHNIQFNLLATQISGAVYSPVVAGKRLFNKASFTGSVCESNLIQPFIYSAAQNYEFNVGIYLTTTNIADPLNNWAVYEAISAVDGSILISSGPKLKEMAGGVIIYP